MKEIRDVLAEQIAEGQRLIESETIALDDTRILHGADMQFIGQTHLISIPIPSLETPKEEIQRYLRRRILTGSKSNCRKYAQIW